MRRETFLIHISIPLLHVHTEYPQRWMQELNLCSRCVLASIEDHQPRKSHSNGLICRNRFTTLSSQDATNINRHIKYDSYLLGETTSIISKNRIQNFKRALIALKHTSSNHLRGAELLKDNAATKVCMIDPMNRDYIFINSE